jgi:hypothetical protein
MLVQCERLEHGPNALATTRGSDSATASRALRIGGPQPRRHKDGRGRPPPGCSALRTACSLCVPARLPPASSVRSSSASCVMTPGPFVPGVTAAGAALAWAPCPTPVGERSPRRERPGQRSSPCWRVDPWRAGVSHGGGRRSPAERRSRWTPTTGAGVGTASRSGPRSVGPPCTPSVRRLATRSARNQFVKASRFARDSPLGVSGPGSTKLGGALGPVGAWAWPRRARRARRPRRPT